MRGRTIAWMVYVLPSDGKNHETSGSVAWHTEKLLGFGDSSCLKMSPERNFAPERSQRDFASISRPISSSNACLLRSRSDGEETAFLLILPAIVAKLIYLRHLPCNTGRIKSFLHPLEIWPDVWI